MNLDGESKPTVPFISKINNMGKILIKFNSTMFERNCLNLHDEFLVVAGVRIPRLEVKFLESDGEEIMFAHNWTCLSYEDDKMQI